MSHLGLVSLVVREYDEAIAFCVDLLGFDLIEDTPLDDQKRWVVVAPPEGRETRLLLARAVTDEELARIGNKPAAASFSFCTPITSFGIIGACRMSEFDSSGHLERSLTGQSPFLKTSTATDGI